MNAFRIPTLDRFNQVHLRPSLPAISSSNLELSKNNNAFYVNLKYSFLVLIVSLLNTNTYKPKLSRSCLLNRNYSRSASSTHQVNKHFSKFRIKLFPRIGLQLNYCRFFCECFAIDAVFRHRVKCICNR